MNLIEMRAAELRAQFIENAKQFGFSPDEIDAATDNSDGYDVFYCDAKAEARRVLAASRATHRRAIRAATPRQPATRRAPRRAAQKKASGSGASDGDGPRWSNEAIDHFFSRLMPICRVDIATGQKGTSVVKLFSSVNRISTPESACFLADYASKYIAARGVLEFEEAIELFHASNFSLNNRMA